MTRILATLAVLLAGSGMGQSALAACPWIVLPTNGAAAKEASYAIMFNGRRDFSSTFYGFTTTGSELARQLRSEGRLPDLDSQGRPLKRIKGIGPLRYRPDPRSVSPLTIYLVASTSRISALDAIAARLEPTESRMIWSQTRGASNFSGPLPRRTLHGVEVQHVENMTGEAEFDFTKPSYQICAYRVASR